MEEVVARDAVQVHLRADGWEDAIRLAAQPLVDRGSVLPSYVDRMIESVHAFGPYMVIMPEVALAHAAPGADVITSDLSVALFDDAISFGVEKEGVRVVICLACVDRKTHLERLGRVAELLLEDSFVQRMTECDSEEELYELING